MVLLMMMLLLLSVGSAVLLLRRAHILRRLLVLEEPVHVVDRTLNLVFGRHVWRRRVVVVVRL